MQTGEGAYCSDCMDNGASSNVQREPSLAGQRREARAGGFAFAPSQKESGQGNGGAFRFREAIGCAETVARGSRTPDGLEQWGILRIAGGAPPGSKLAMERLASRTEGTTPPSVNDDRPNRRREGRFVRIRRVRPFHCRWPLDRFLSLSGTGLLNPSCNAAAQRPAGDARRPASYRFPFLSKSLDDLIRLPLGAARLTLPPVGKTL